MSNNSTQTQAVAFIRVNPAAVGSEKAFKDNVNWQRQQCQEHAERHGLAIIREYVDKSGGVSIERRSMLREMLAELHALHDAGYVITTDEARITRKANELAYIRLQLEIAGARLVCTKYAELSPTAQDAMTQMTATIATLAEQDYRARRRTRKPAGTGSHTKGVTV